MLKRVGGRPWDKSHGFCFQGETREKLGREAKKAHIQMT